MSSFGIGRYDSGLSPPTSSVRMMIGRFRSHRLDDGFVSLELLLFGGRVGALHEEKFGAEQAHSFTSQTAHLGSIFQSADVGDYFDAPAVEGDRGLDLRERGSSCAAASENSCARRIPATCSGEA